MLMFGRSQIDVRRASNKQNVVVSVLKEKEVTNNNTIAEREKNEIV